MLSRTVMFKLSWAENCIQLILLFLKIELLRKCVNGSAWTSYLKLENSMSFSIQIQAPRFVFRANSKSTKLEILEKIRPRESKTKTENRLTTFEFQTENRFWNQIGFKISNPRKWAILGIIHVKIGNFGPLILPLVFHINEIHS